MCNLGDDVALALIGCERDRLAYLHRHGRRNQSIKIPKALVPGDSDLYVGSGSHLLGRQACLKLYRPLAFLAIFDPFIQQRQQQQRQRRRSE